MRARLALLVSLCLAGGAGVAQADTWTDLWSTREQQAQKLLDSKHPEAAAPLFNDARRRAYAEFEAGQFAKAAKSLAPFKDADSQYNRGNALAHAGQLREALNAYDAALAAAPGDKDIVRNRDLVKRALEQQQNQSGQQGGSKGDPGSQGSKGGQSQGGNNSPDGGQPRQGGQSQAGHQTPGGQSQADRSQNGQSQSGSQQGSNQAQSGNQQGANPSQSNPSNGASQANNQAGSRSQGASQQGGGQSANQAGQQPGSSSQAVNQSQGGNQQQAGQTQSRDQNGGQSSQSGGQSQAANPSQSAHPSQSANPSQAANPSQGSAPNQASATRPGDDTAGEGALAPNGQPNNSSTAASGLNAENAQQDANAALRYRQSEARSGTESNPRGTANVLSPDGKTRSSAGVPPPKPPSEQSMALDQWLRGIPDDSAELLRRKFLIEHMLKQQRNEP